MYTIQAGNQVSVPCHETFTMYSRNMNTSPFSKKGEISYTFQVWKITEEGTMSLLVRSGLLCLPFSSPLCKRGSFPASPNHVTKKNLWHERVPQTLWQGRPLHLVCQQVCPCMGVQWRTSLMSSSLLLQQSQHVMFILFEWFVRWEASGRTAAILLGASSRICSKQHPASLWSFHISFSQSISLKSKWYYHTIVLIHIFTSVLFFYFTRQY